MKKNYFRLLKALLMFMVALSSVLTSRASNHERIQQIFDGIVSTTRSESSITVIDISEYPELQEPVTETIFVEKRSLMLTNGTMTQAAGFNGPIIKIVNGNTLELAYTAKLSGNNKKSDYPLVDVADGTFNVFGSIENIYGGVNPTPNSDMNTAVELSGGDKASLSQSVFGQAYDPGMQPSRIQGRVENSKGGNMQFNSGYVGRISTSKGFRLSQTIVQANVYFYNQDISIMLASPLISPLYLSNYAKDQRVIGGIGASPGINYDVTTDDMDKVVLGNNTNNYVLELYGGAIYVREASNPVRTISNVEPGTLPDRISEADRSIIEELTLTGKLNGTDIRLIREMGCKKLKKLDISQCWIVEGGDKYALSTEYTPSATEKSAEINIRGGAIIITQGWSTKNDVIGMYMFANLSKLETIVLPNTVVTIETGAFMDSPKLTNITFGRQLKDIPSCFLFYGSNNIRNLNVNSSNTTFSASNGVLYNRDKSVIVAVSPALTGTFGISLAIDSISPYAFAGCMGITTVTFNGSPTRINDYAFCQSGLTSISIPWSVKRIGNGAFMSCECLSKVSFTENIESIGYGAFAYCKLTEADLSATKVTDMGGDEHSYPIATPEPYYTYHLGVFQGTETITSVKLPSTIMNIGGKVFTSPLIKDIYCHSLPPTIWYKYTYSSQGQIGGYGYAVSDTFSDIYSTCRLHVPNNTVSYYKEATGWKEFYNIVGDQAPIADPNTVFTEEELQKRLDEIASQKPANPVNIKICEEGITLTKNILARQNCKAIISGGPISVKQGYGGNVLFYVDYEAYLGFNNISFDFMNFRYRPSCFYVSFMGILEISESVKYKNISTNTVLGWGREQGFYRNEGKMILRGGDISGIEGNGISNCGVIDMRGDIFKYGIRIYNYFNVNTSGIYLGTIRLLSSIPETGFWSFNGNWDEYQLETPFIVSSDSYTMQASDSWQIKFTGLPSKELKRTAYYDDSRHSVQLKTYRSAQDIFDGDEEETLDCDGADVGEDLSISQKQQLIFNGDCPEETPTIWMPGGCVFFEPLLPWATISDITFNSFTNGHRIYVRTRVEYKSNVRSRNFIWFTIVEKGGYLIWRNAWTENVLYPIYNDGGTVDIIGGNLTGTSYNLNGGIFGIWGDTKVNNIDNNATLTLGGNVSLKEIKQGPLGKVILTSKLYNKWTIDLAGHSAYDYYDGQFILEGGNGYVLTAADLALIDFRLPAGCSISLDTVRNAIVLHVAAFLPGDVNLDWAVDVADIAAVISVMAESDGSLTKTTDVNGDGTVDVADIATIIDIMAGKTVPTPAGHKTVNLGLPSGTLWAETNIGAVSPEDYGSYFAWGETGEKTTFGWNNYIWCNGTQASMTKYCTSTDFGTVDGKRQLDLSDDVAHATWGGSWRMPTGGDIEELLNNTTSEWTTQNGVVGRKFYSKTNGNSIFLPAAGYRMGVNTGNAGNMGSYWTSSLQEDAQYGAKILYFTSNAAASDYAFYRYVGQPVRPVYKKAVVVDGIVELTSGIANWDAAYLTGKGYFCYKKDATTSTSAGSNYHSLTYIPLNSSDMVCIIAKKSDNLPTQLVTKTGVVYFSYLNNSVLELVYDDGKSVNVLGSMPCSKEYLQTLSSLHKGDAFKSLLAIASALLKGNTGSTTIGTTYKNYAELFGTVSNESYAQNDAAVASIATSATGNFLFAEETEEWYDETVEFIFNTLQLWTGEATFKVGGSSCTLSGAVFCPSDVYNDYGTYGIICDANKANLTLGNAEYEQAGYQSPADMGFSVDFRGFKPNTTYYYRAYYKFNSSNHGNISPKHGNMTDPVIYDTTIKSFKTGDNILTVDVAMCIDVTGSMSDIINTVKSNAISFYDQFKQSCEEEGIQLAALNTQVFAYRDKNVDTNWLQTSSTFSLPSQRTAFNNFVNGLKADGGGDGPESGLETLQAAFNKSDWGVDDGYHRHVVILWTDAPYLVGSSYSNVELSTLASQWNAMPSGRRLILFAPYGTSSSNGGSWGNLDGWTNLIHETDLTNGFNNFDYILKSIIGELTSKAKARMSRPIQEETYFRPNE